MSISNQRPEAIVIGNFITLGCVLAANLSYYLQA